MDRQGRLVKLLLAGAMGMWLVSVPPAWGADTTPAPADAASPEASEGAAPAPGWRVQCTGVGAATDCRLSQMVVLKRTKQLLLALVVHRPAKGQPPRVLLHLPHGLFLPAGSSLKLDDAAADQLPIESCDRRGCYAGMGLDDSKLAALQAGKTLTIQFQNLKKQAINVTLPMKGFAEAYSQLP